MGQEILNERQKQVLAAVSQEPALSDFYLTGGTALAAYYFQHRFSEDLDLFSFNEPDKIFLHAFTGKLKNLFAAEAMRFERFYDRHQFFFKFGGEELKVEFTTYPFHQLEEPILQDGLRIDSLRDIAVNKLMAMIDRFDPKDFIDLFYILQEFKIDDIRKDAEKKFGVSIGDIFLGGELAKVRRIEALPKMLKPLTIGELKEFFERQAKELKDEILE